MMLPDFDPATLPAEQIPAALAQLSAWQGQLAARLMAPAPAAEVATDAPERMLTTIEAAGMLRRSTKWIYRNNKRLPFARRLSERSWVYSEQGLRRWLARQRV
jgi:hypothetical protein